MKKRVKAIIIDFLRSMIDIPVAIGFMNENIVSNLHIGFLGTLTSLIGCY